MAQRFRGGGGVAGALGGLPPGAGRNPPVDPAAAFAASSSAMTCETSSASRAPMVAMDSIVFSWFTTLTCA